MFSQASVNLSTWGCAWQGACMWRACMTGAWMAGGVCGRRDGHCSERYASYWNAFLYFLSPQHVKNCSVQHIGRTMTHNDLHASHRKTKSNQIIALLTKWDKILRFCFGTAKGSGGAKQIRLSEEKLLQTNNKFLLVACRGGNDPRLLGSKIEGWPGRGWNPGGRDVLLCSVWRHKGIRGNVKTVVMFTFTRSCKLYVHSELPRLNTTQVSKNRRKDV